MVIGVDEFRNSTSLFRSEEEKALGIEIVAVSNITNIFPDALGTNTDILEPLQELVLGDFDASQTRTYYPNKDDGLTTRQRRFLIKLRLVLINNDPDLGASHCERFLDDLVGFLCEEAGLDDGLNMTLRPCNLQLTIGESTFAALADREGRRGSELAWLLQEDKHRKSSTYKHGDVQLACAMIAATQQNYNMLEEIYPSKIIGIKFVADDVYFCSMIPTQEYIEGLLGGSVSTQNIVQMQRFGPLSLSSPNERVAVLQHLTSLHRWAMSLTPK